MAWTTAGSRSGMSGYEWHAKHSEQGFGINQRELLQISNPSQQNQRGCPLSTGALCFLYFFALLCPIAALLFYLGFSGPIASVLSAALAFSAGAFMCIALADLLPEVQFHSHDKLVLTGSFLAGLLIASALGVLEPHYHQ